VTRIIEETPNIKSFQVVFNDAEKMKNFKYEPGQVGQLSIFGVGESTFVINSPPTRMEYLQFSVMKAGEVTAALHNIYEGDEIGVRAPLGNWFPYNEMKGKNILFIGGGIGLAPLRPVVDHVLAHRTDYGKLDILFGARTPGDMIFRADLAAWGKDAGVKLVKTIDIECVDWDGCVGLLPTVVKEQGYRPDGRIAVVCGPPIMIRFTMATLRELNWPDAQVYTTLEMKMQCGIGQCGRCNIGGKYVCKDGPVFRLDAIPFNAL